MRKKSQRPETNKAVIYTRVSTEDQVKNLSLQTQEDRAREFCASRGWSIVRVFREEGQSAKTTRRDEFQRMIQFCKEARNGIGHIVVYDLSRFARNMRDQLDTERELLEAGVRIESVKEPTEDSALGRWQRNMVAVQNQFENERRAERTVDGMTQAVKAGRFTFKAPLGYINVSQRHGHNLIADPKTAPLITKAFEMIATGSHSKAEVLRKLNALGLTTRTGRPVPTQTFQRTLRNPIYAGWVSIPAWELKERGKHEPLVSEELFNTVQDVLDGTRAAVVSYQRNHPDFPLRVLPDARNAGHR